MTREGEGRHIIVTRRTRDRRELSVFGRFVRPDPDRLRSWISGTESISCDPPNRSERTEHVGLFRRRNRDYDPAILDPYRAAVSGTIAQYRDRFLTRGGTTELLEGGPAPKPGRHPRVPRHRGGETLVRLLRVTENTANPGRQLDRPGFHCRRRDLTQPTPTPRRRCGR
jgi:hypothetical protein